MNQPNPNTVIVGAGFAGLFTALHLRHQKYISSIILIDPQERFVFKPMLFEMMTEELGDDTVCPSYQELLQGSDITFIQDRVSAIDLKQRRVNLASGQNLHYSHLVLAVGGVQGYFNTSGTPDYVYPFRTREHLLSLKEHLRYCLEQASQSEDAEKRRDLLTFAIVGAGPTGVEMAATLADLLPVWYAKLNGNIHEIRIILINHGKKILSGDVNAHLQNVALESLKNRIIPVKLILGVSVKAIYEDRLEYQSEQIETLKTYTTIWTAGTEINPIISTLAIQIPADHLNKHGLPQVKPTLQLLDFPEVFGAGDCVDIQQPALAQVAYQQGATIAHNLIAMTKGVPLDASEVKLRGTLMKLGLGNGVANLFDKIQIDGKGLA